jgi:hypothetical protein
MEHVKLCHAHEIEQALHCLEAEEVPRGVYEQPAIRESG